MSTPTLPRRAPLEPALRRARTAVAASFVLNGLVFASLVSRLPDLRERLGLSNGGLGTLLLAISVGSLLALPSTGRVIEGIGAGATVRAGVLADTVGLSTAALGAALGSLPLAAVGLFVHGVGIGVWDVAMNVEAAEVERTRSRPPLCRMARSNRSHPLAIMVATAIAPEDCPAAVTASGSPPNAPMFSRIHCSAHFWSRSVRLVEPAPCQSGA